MSLNFDTSVAAWRSDAALVWHFNDILVPWPLNRIAGKTAQIIADERVVASDSVTNHYFPASASEDVQRLFAPVDLDEFDPNAVTGSGLTDELGDHNAILIGSVGNINPIKGHEYLVRAAAKIDAKIDRKIIVQIAGGILDSREMYFERLKQIRSDLGLDKTVQFLGRRSDIAELLAQFDVFVLPSIAEACPMSVLEAMAMEKPIVATDVGGIPEQIVDGESGWLVPSKDPDALAAAIIEALQNKNERQRRAKKARERAVNMFSLERCAERHLQLYHQACR
jgi:glycosyltransferase involved in cell wall biosynthesis